jgi:hypothetical protein
LPATAPERQETTPSDPFVYARDKPLHFGDTTIRTVQVTYTGPAARLTVWVMGPNASEFVPNVTGGFPLLSSDGTGPSVSVSYNGPNNVIRSGAILFLQATTLDAASKTSIDKIPLFFP